MFNLNASYVQVMARVQNPTLFSANFGVPTEALATAGLIDPFVDVDVPLFIDPVLLEKSNNKTINTTALARFRKHFEILVRMLAISKAENDAAWKGARRQLDLSEPPENGLGYGGGGRSGSSRPEDIREAILRTSKEIVALGASQLIYYAIADAFCKANDVEISPEANMGGGPIDFKFSSGYQARVLVEMERSSGAVVHGYEKQLEFYKAASQTDFGVFVVVDYGDLGNKLNEIRRIRAERLKRAERASEIVVIDATRKASASK